MILCPESQIYQKPWETFLRTGIGTGLVLVIIPSNNWQLLADPCRSCLSWHVSLSLWMSLIQLLPLAGCEQNLSWFSWNSTSSSNKIKTSHLFSLLPNVFPRGLAICHGTSYVNLNYLAELSASLISRKAGGAAYHPLPLTSHRAVLRSALVQGSQQVQQNHTCP